LPVRAARLAGLKVPKPTRVTESPLDTALTTAPMTAARVRSAAALLISASLATTSMSSIYSSTAPDHEWKKRCANHKAISGAVACGA
jgi:hypothetical protein